MISPRFDQPEKGVSAISPPPCTPEAKLGDGCSSKLIAASSAAHRANLAHGDVKLGNMLVDRHGRVRVIDFGLACSLANPDRERRSTYGGTPQYRAPECWAGEPVDEQRADQTLRKLCVGLDLMLSTLFESFGLGARNENRELVLAARVLRALFDELDGLENEDE